MVTCILDNAFSHSFWAVFCASSKVTFAALSKFNLAFATLTLEMAVLTSRVSKVVSKKNCYLHSLLELWSSQYRIQRCSQPFWSLIKHCICSIWTLSLNRSRSDNSVLHNIRNSKTVHMIASANICNICSSFEQIDCTTVQSGCAQTVDKGLLWRA